MSSIDGYGIELGKSLAKILLSEKYNDYTMHECLEILDIAHAKCKELLANHV